MKAVKGKLLKKLKTIKPLVYLKQQEGIFQVNALDGFIPTLSKNPSFNSQSHVECEEMKHEEAKNQCFVNNEEADVIDVAEVMRDLEEEEEMEEDDENWDDKENVGLPRKVQESGRCFDGNVGNSVKPESRGGSLSKQVPLSEIDISSFRRPDLNSCSLFDPNLLAAFEQAVKEHMRLSEAERQERMKRESLERRKLEAEVEARIERDSCGKIQEEKERETKIEEMMPELCEEEPPFKTRRIDDEVHEDDNHLLSFEERCPPGGSVSVVLYTTTLQGIRKTFQDCNSIRFLLESFRVVYFERDVSMHMEFKEELWRVMDRKIMPPRLFIRGRYIGGAEEVLTLHEQGKLKMLFEGVPMDQSSGPCEACGGLRFVLCFNCSGSHRVISDDGLSSKCRNCNENGLIICPLCC